MHTNKKFPQDVTIDIWQQARPVIKKFLKARVCNETEDLVHSNTEYDIAFSKSQMF